MATLVERISAGFAAVRTKINTLTPRVLPPGGAAGEALVKTSGDDFATAWAAASGGLVGHPGYVAGRYYPTFPRLTTWANAAGAADMIYYSAVYIPAATKIERWGLKTGTTNAVAGNAKVALYANTNGRPGDKLFDIGSVVVPGTAGSNIVLLAPVDLAAGWYWLAIHGDAAIQWSGCNAEVQHSWWFGTTNTAAWGANTSHVAGYFETGVAYADGPPPAAGAVTSTTSAVASAVMRIAQ